MDGRLAPARASLLPRLGLALVLAVGPGCADVPDAASLANPPPSAEKLPAMASSIALRLGRSSCSTCPDSWPPQPCEVLTELQRAPSPLDAVACASLDVPHAYPGVPERLLPTLSARLPVLVEELQGVRPKQQAAEALRLYALGVDLQRLGTVALWNLGLQARTQALVLLARAPSDRTWPRDLLFIEAAAPPPARVGDVALLEVLVGLRGRDPGWNGRVAVADAHQAARHAMRANPEVRGNLVRQVGEALDRVGAGGPERPDLVDAWAAAELVKTSTIEIALRGALGNQKRCPGSLDELVTAGQLESVPQGWTLDPVACRPQAPPVAPPPEAPPVAAEPVSAEPVSAEPSAEGSVELASTPAG